MNKVSLQLMLDLVIKIRNDIWHNAAVMIASKLRFSQNRPVRNAKCPVRNAISPEWLTLWRKNFKPICYPLRAPSRINNIFVWIIWAIPVGQTMFMSIFSLLYLLFYIFPVYFINKEVQGAETCTWFWFESLFAKVFLWFFSVFLLRIDDVFS